jgi:hypothetical protein
MTVEEMIETLRGLGIPVNQWGNAPGGENIKSPMVERQKELLTQVRDLLEKQIKDDKDKVSELHAVVQRMKHGGGI